MNISLSELNRDIAELKAILAAMAKKRVLVAEVEAAEHEMYRQGTGPEALKLAAELVSTEFKVSLVAIMGPRRLADVAFARQVICWLGFDVGVRSAAMEKFFGKKHGLVQQALRTVNARMETEPNCRARILGIKTKLEQCISNQPTQHTK